MSDNLTERIYDLVAECGVSREQIWEVLEIRTVEIPQDEHPLLDRVKAAATTEEFMDIREGLEEGDLEQSMIRAAMRVAVTLEHWIRCLRWAYSDSPETSVCIRAIANLLEEQEQDRALMEFLEEPMGSDEELQALQRIKP
ncbi:MAG TPA: hypothetical protein VF829_00630 [Candidatus Paceibacterota bacterium]